MLLPGAVVDGFKVTRLVAEGAMGQVYLAHDERLDRYVALKFIKGGALDAKGLERFGAEARTTAQFNHPHIVTVYAAGAFEGRPWIALEYLDGENLRERLERGPLPVVEALRLAKATAEALREAHRFEVVHADLKPENVLLPRDGRVRVVDFGLARLVGTEATAGSGTPSYMAPERWHGEKPRPSMDVWALGVILHEAIEGRRPFTDQELAAMAFAPRPPTLGTRVQLTPCASLIADCLRPDADRRPSAHELVERLDRLLEGREVVDGRSPFRGLEPFSEVDAIDLHGRADEVDLAAERLEREGLLAVFGPLGVGKTSFVVAGVMHRLREKAAWELVTVRPGPHPWADLATALGCEMSALTSSVEGLGVQLRRLSAKGSKVMLFIDQAEQLHVQAPPEARAAVSEALARAASADAPWRVIVAFRSEGLEGFAGTALRGAVKTALVLKTLGRGAIEQAFNAPLERLDVAIDDPSLPADLSAELDGQPAPLPLFQLAARALWERRDTGWRMLLRREYEALGGVAGALARHAEQVVTNLLPDERQLARAVLLRLLAPDGSRQRKTRAQLIQGLPAEAGAALDRLLEQRLVATGRSDETGAAQYELAHTLLVAAWPTLARWIGETRDIRALEQELEQAARVWHQRGRKPEETWSKDSLLHAVDRLRAGEISLIGDSKPFLESGLAWHDAREKKAKQRRTVRRALAAVAVLLLVGGAAAITSLRSRLAVQERALELAAADVGRFELVLEPFDWDAAHLERQLVSAEGLSLQFQFAPGRERSREPSRVDAQGRLRALVEVSAGATAIELSGRGGECGPLTVQLPRLPGYAARNEALRTLIVPVPTCAATRAGVVVVPQGEGFVVEIDRATAVQE